MHDPVRAQYPLASMTDALTRLLNAKQGLNENLIDYIKRFKQLRDVMKVIWVQQYWIILLNNLQIIKMKMMQLNNKK